MRTRVSIVAAWLCVIAACSTDATEEEVVGTTEAPITTPFSWRMAGVLAVGGETITASSSSLMADHFSYVGNMAMNGCSNNTAPYSCATNGCNYPGNPQSSEIPTYSQLQAWIQSYRSAGMYAGIWGVTYTNVEAEAHCMAEISNHLGALGTTPTFLIVDGEKSFETNQNQSQRFVSQLNSALTVSLAKGYTTECHLEIPFSVWINGGFTSIQPQAYWNDSGVDPLYCMNWSKSHGVPAAMNQVMLDGYKHGTPHTWNEYAQDMAAFGAQPGFNIWRSLNPDEWPAWKGRIETYHLATYPGSGTATCTNKCTVGGKRCVNGDVYQDCIVAANGCTVWSSQHSCAGSYPGTTCSAGYCVGCTNQCVLGAKQCAGGSTDLYQECVKAASGCTAWSQQYSCKASWPTTHCSAGYCVGN